MDERELVLRTAAGLTARIPIGPARNRDMGSARALASWVESLAAASRLLQRRLAETNSEFPFDFARIISRS